MKVLCGIPTCNREYYLKRCINKLEKLILKPDLILIVNQGDSSISISSSLNIKVINQENHGSASGWHTLIQFFLGGNFDYIWLMDDDGFPSKNSLSLLTNNFKENFSCLASIVVEENNPKRLVFNMPYIDRGKESIFFRINDLNKLKKISRNNFYPFAHLFNGALISYDAIKNIGNVKKDFKIYGEEVDFFYRLKKYGEVLTLIDSYHFHPSVRGKKIKHENIYYLIKNTIINNNKYSKRNHFKNIITIFITLVRVTQRNGIFSTFIFLFKKNYFIKSILHGYQNN